MSTNGRQWEGVGQDEDSVTDAMEVAGGSLVRVAAGNGVDMAVAVVWLPGVSLEALRAPDGVSPARAGMEKAFAELARDHADLGSDWRTWARAVLRIEGLTQSPGMTDGQLRLGLHNVIEKYKGAG